MLIHSALRSLARRIVPALFIASAAMGVVGCASAPELTLTSISKNQSYRQGFVKAYTARNSAGDTDVVLVDDATERMLSGHPAVGGVRQVMYFRIIWTPTSSMKASSCNASVKWYIIGADQPRDVLEYCGIGFVSMSEEDGVCTLQVSNAMLKPGALHGTLTDPVGLSRLEGQFTARSNPEKVKQVLSDVRSAVASTKAPSPALTSLAHERESGSSN